MHEHDEETDDYLMYVYKARTRTHDWTECPLAHRQEKLYPYMGVVCPDFKNGECLKGLNREYANGVFDFWLYPSKFRAKPRASEQCCSRGDARGMEGIGAGRVKAAAATTVAAAKAEPLAVATPVAPPVAAAPSTSGGRDAKYSDYPQLGMIVDLVVNW